MFTSLPTIIRVSGFSAALLVVAQVALFFSAGVGQDPLQFFHPPAEYAAVLLKNPVALRAVITLDNLFIVGFTVMFVALFAQLLEFGAHRALVYAAVGCTLLLTVLDMVENFHFMTMLAVAEQGVLPSLNHIQFQVWESLLKFHVGYLGVFFMGLALPRETAHQRVLAFACCWLSLPIGVLVYGVPARFSPIFLYGRFSFFLFALTSVGLLFGAGKGSMATGPSRLTVPAAADSSALG